MRDDRLNFDDLTTMPIHEFTRLCNKYEVYWLNRGRYVTAKELLCKIARRYEHMVIPSCE